MHKRKGRNTLEDVEVMLMDRVAFEQEGRDTGQSRKVQNIMHVTAKRRIGRLFYLTRLKHAV